MKKLIVVLLLVMAASVPAMANVIANGDFETGDWTGYLWAPVGDGTFITGFGAYEGSYAAQMQNSAAGSWSGIYTGWNALPAGATNSTPMEFSFAVKNLDAFASASVVYKGYVVDENFESINYPDTAWEGHIFESNTGELAAGGDWQIITVPFTLPRADSGENAYIKLELFGYGWDSANSAPLHNAGANPIMIDAITVVPEPATMAILGLGGLLLRRRRV